MGFLRECPFCGGQVRLMEGMENGRKEYEIRCESCKAIIVNKTGKYNKDATVTAFNKRPERKAHWEMVAKPTKAHIKRCSNCGATGTMPTKDFRYCPICGYYMEVTE